MVWARFDDDVLTNPKVAQLDVWGWELWTKAVVWARKHSPVGFVPATVLRILSTARKPLDVAKQLVEAVREPGGVGLFEPVEGGFIIHDFDDFGPPPKASTVNPELSRKRAEAGRKGGARSVEVKQVASSKPSNLLEANQANNDKQTKQVACLLSHVRADARPRPDPDPDPVPEYRNDQIASPLAPLAPTAPSEDPETAIRDALDACGEIPAEDVERTFRGLMADTIACGYTAKRIAQCLPFHLRELALCKDPTLNPVAFVVKGMRGLARPGALETRIAAEQAKTVWRTEAAAKTVEKHDAWKREAVEGNGVLADPLLADALGRNGPGPGNRQDDRDEQTPKPDPKAQLAALQAARGRIGAGGRPT